MTSATIAIVVVGVALVGAVGVGAGFDIMSLILFALIVALGAVAIAAARRTRGGGLRPRACAHCGGLISAMAPICTHCGARQEPVDPP
jgi:hypothetical protein